jgi:divalent metal cation (Fe/Co/Zn/Cd) transporter
VILLSVGAGMLWSGFRKLESPDTVPRVHIAALWVALGAHAAKELLFRYMLAIAALIVGFLVAKMGWSFGWQALLDLMDRSADAVEVEAIRKTLLDTPGVRSVHDLRT